MWCLCFVVSFDWNSRPRLITADEGSLAVSNCAISVSPPHRIASGTGDKPELLRCIVVVPAAASIYEEQVQPVVKRVSSTKKSANWLSLSDSDILASSTTATLQNHLSTMLSWQLSLSEQELMWYRFRHIAASTFKFWYGQIWQVDFLSGSTYSTATDSNVWMAECTEFRNARYIDQGKVQGKNSQWNIGNDS